MNQDDLLKDSFYEQEKRKHREMLDQFRPDKKAYTGKKRNTRRMVLLDLLLLVILAGVLYPFILSRFGPDRRVGDYSFHYNVFLSGETAMHSLSVEANREPEDKSALMEVQFYQNGTALGSPLVDLVPVPGRVRQFTREGELAPGTAYWECIVLLDGEEIARFRQEY